jgi:hypothetical protein
MVGEEQNDDEYLDGVGMSSKRARAKFLRKAYGWIKA